MAGNKWRLNGCTGVRRSTRRTSRFREASGETSPYFEGEMTSDCKFAITIPCYKSESTITDTLRGIMGQGEGVLRRVACVVIADDVSPDNTVDVVRDVWALAWPPLKFESRRKNVGEMINVNTAVTSLPNDVEWFLHRRG